MSDRIPCIVPFCRRTAPRSKFPDPATRIICGKHWRAVSKRYRRVYTRAMRRCNRGKVPVRVMNRLWDHLERKAIEAAGGLA